MMLAVGSGNAGAADAHDARRWVGDVREILKGL